MNKLLNILIIDDDEVDRIILKRALRDSGFFHVITECTEASSLPQFLSGTSDFDCIFLDYQLPGSDGLALLKKIKERKIKSPVVITTSHGDEKIAVEMMKNGAQDYIIKSQINAGVITPVLRNIIRLNDAEKQREKAETALKISEARLAEAQRIARIGNWEFDFNDKTVYWSDEVFKIMEAPGSSYIPSAENYLEYIYPGDVALIQETVMKVRKGDNFSVDCRILTQKGNVKYCHLQGYSIVDENKNIQKIIGTIQDITERKSVEQELIEAQQIADESTKVKENFLATMSHEIRNLLNAIIGFTSLLSDTKLDDEQKNYAGSIHFAGENLMRIINDILDFSRIKAGKLTFENIDFNLTDVINPLIAMFQPKAKENNIEISCRIESSVPNELQGDPVRLNQVLINLIGNALKFTEKGYIKINVKLITQNEHETVLKFLVEDTGIGIPDNKLGSIFESFTQAGNEITRKYGGSGLGLSIVRNIVELQGGSISVKSIYGQGSTFGFILPFRKSNISGADKNYQQDDVLADDLKNISILLVEDMKINQQLIKATLNKIGCSTIDIASTGKNAIEKILSARYHLVLLDMQLPDISGMEVVAFLRKQKDYINDIPVIAITANSLEHNNSYYTDMGINDFIIKPFKPELLCKKINKLLVGNRVFKKQENENKKPDDTTVKIQTEMKYIDMNYLKMLIGDNQEIIRETFTLLLSEIPPMLNEMNKHLYDKNWNLLKQTAHKLKPSMRLVNVSSVQEITSSIEKYASEKSNLDILPGLVEQVTSICQDAIQEMKTYLENKME